MNEAGDGEAGASRDRRFVAIRRGGLLDDATHRLIVAWAVDCAEHVLPLFSVVYPCDDRPRHAIEIARAWSRGEATVGEARKAASSAHAAAREATVAAAREAARATGHAAATGHMADHSLAAAAYAVKAARSAVAPQQAPAAGVQECQWQREQIPEALRSGQALGQRAASHADLAGPHPARAAGWTWLVALGDQGNG